MILLLVLLTAAGLGVGLGLSFAGGDGKRLTYIRISLTLLSAHQFAIFTALPGLSHHERFDAKVMFGRHWFSANSLTVFAIFK